MPLRPSRFSTLVTRGIDFVQRARVVRREGGPGVRQQIVDFRYFHRATGISPIEFHRYRLWDRGRPLAERLAYLSHEEKRIIEAAVNPAAAIRALNNKAAASQRLRNAGIRLPSAIGQIDLSGPPPVDLATAAAALADLCRSAGATGVVLKPNQGMGGYDVQVYQKADLQGLTRLDGSTLSYRDATEQLLHRPAARWNVERRLIPHPDLASIAPFAIASMRVQSFRRKSGAVHLGPAVLKIPLGQSGIDNFGSGNIATPIDLTTGQIGMGATLAGARQLAAHPTTGAPFDKVRIPDLPEALTLVRRAAEELSELAFLGWDVALTSEGPVILEGNAWSGVDILQMVFETGMATDANFIVMLEEYALSDLIRRRAG